MTSSTERKVEQALSLLAQLDINPLELIIALVEHPKFEAHGSLLKQALIQRWDLFDTVAKSKARLVEEFRDEIASEVVSLTRSKSFRFNVSKLTEETLANVEFGKMAAEMKTSAPQLWSLVGLLLSANKELLHDRERKRKSSKPSTASQKRARTAMASSSFDGELEAPIERPDEVALGQGDEDLLADELSTAEERDQALLDIKRIVCISIMMQSTNRLSDALQGVVGVFLHSCGTPETVREFLSHVGLSISVSSINDAIKNLSKTASARIREQGKSVLTSYAYDNLDIDLKHSMTVLENSQDTLVHLTTATILPLEHGVTPADLDCAEEVWKATVEPRINPDAPKPPPISIEQLSEIHPEQPHESGLDRHELFRVWKFLEDLILQGPAYFHQFRQQLGDPETVDGIPVMKTSQIPMCAMDVKPSSPAENGEALKKMFEQSGVGDPKDTLPGTKNPRNWAILVWGDLLTGQHLRSLLESRAEEDTPWRQLININFNMGLFHLKMACADTIYKTFIVPKEGRLDKTSLMAFVALLRPKETGKIESNPGFRRMHEVIQHVGTALRLDMWRLAATASNAGHQTLEQFAESQPTWDSLVKMANEMVKTHAPAKDLRETRETHKPEDRDMQHENVLAMHDYFLWYEEMSYALNYGDIGRVESLFVPWMFIFRGCGKHKYAAELRRYLENIHFIFPKRLARAIRMNILCNPTGKKGAFRGIDWLVEHNNLYIKRIYGGKYSNHQKDRIIAESVLIELYKRVRLQLETMFRLEHKTSRHSSPDMQSSFKRVMEHMQKERANEFIKGRSTNYEVPDVMEKGMSIWLQEARTGRTVGTEDSAEDGETMELDEEDLEMD